MHYVTFTLTVQSIALLTELREKQLMSVQILPQNGVTGLQCQLLLA